MRSIFADKFNHDNEAQGYDQNVLDEANPGRAGYDALLSWVATEAHSTDSARVLDLGCGTGNLSLRLSQFKSLVCVDTSKNMIEVAKGKFEAAGKIAQVIFAQSDFLEYFKMHLDRFDRIISTYALHHLVDSEKKLLFELVWERLNPGGIASFGDLMFESRDNLNEIYARLTNEGKGDLVKKFQEEFFWDLTSAKPALERLGFEVKTKRFSELSWGLVARKPN